MKMRVMMLALAAGVLLVASCGKNIDNPQPNTLDITLKARVANSAPATKTTYTDPGDGSLSVQWEASEYLSVLTIDSDGVIVRNETIEYSGPAGDDALFKGTVTALGEGQSYLCVYPKINSYVILGGGAGDSWFDFDGTDSVVQTANKDASHLAKADLMTGVPTFTGDEADVTLTRQIGVLKLVMQFPSDLIASQLGLIAFMPKEGQKLYPNLHVSQLANPEPTVKAIAKDAGFLLVSFGGIVPADGKVVAYAPIAPGTILTGKYEIVIQTGETDFKNIVMTCPEEVVIEKGKMTTLSIDASGTWTDGM